MSRTTRALFATEGEIPTNLCPIGVFALELALQGCVYVIRHLGSGKEYVGITVRGPEVRWLQHIKAASQGSSNLVHRALAKDSVTAFKFEVIWNGPASELFEREKQFILDRSSLMPRGYNMTSGGERLPVRVPQSRAMLRFGVENILKDPLVAPYWIGEIKRNRLHDLTHGDYCVLNLFEAGQLIDWRRWPCCTNHWHMKRSKVEKGNFAVLQTKDGTPLRLALPHTELIGWVRWDWDNDLLGDTRFGGYMHSFA